MGTWEPVILGLLTAAMLIWLIEALLPRIRRWGSRIRTTHPRPDLDPARVFVPISVPPAASDRGGACCSRPLEPTADDCPSMQRGFDPQLGPYMYGHIGWFQYRNTQNGRPFQVCGTTPSPTADQTKLWTEIDQRLPEVLQTAIAAVIDPGPDLPDFRRDKLYLEECRLLDDGSVELFLGPSLRSRDGMDELALVFFRDWQAVDMCWST